jgi:hypothetical protein
MNLTCPTCGRKFVVKNPVSQAGGRKGGKAKVKKGFAVAGQPDRAASHAVTPDPEWTLDRRFDHDRPCRECVDYNAGACRLHGAVVSGWTRGRACFKARAKGGK